MGYQFFRDFQSTFCYSICFGWDVNIYLPAGSGHVYLQQNYGYDGRDFRRF